MSTDTLSTPQAETPPESADWADQAEQRMLAAAIALAPDLGWGGPLFGKAAIQAGLPCCRRVTIRRRSMNSPASTPRP
jgi:ubiquinone biosynthesis protein COQ9